MAHNANIGEPRHNPKAPHHGKSQTAPAWRRVFLRELARSGSVALAARACGIDRTSPYQTRRRNPAFAANWDRPLAAGRTRLTFGIADGDTPPPRAAR